LTTGELVAERWNYCWASDVEYTGTRAYQYYCNNAGETQVFGYPTVEVVDGTESKLFSNLGYAALLNAQQKWADVSGTGKPADYADVTAYNTSAGIIGQGALATQNAALWSTQVTGLNKPADNADVTAYNTAAAIAGQGALATANSANWSTQVVGTGKPADNADVTNYNDTRVSNVIEENSTLLVSRPVGASFNNDQGAVTGMIRIILPQGFTNTMMKFTVNVYTFSSDKSFSLHLAGYNYETSTWHNTEANLIGSTAADNRVRFGYDSTLGKCCIYIGEPTSSWSYPKVMVKDFIAGYLNFARSQWEIGWAIDIVTSAPQNVTQDYADALLDAANIKNQGAFATLNLITSDNTTTYIDSANGKVLNNLQQWTEVNGATKPEDNATKSRVFQQATAPTSGMTLNDLWVDTTTLNPAVYRWSGASWILAGDITANNTAAAIAGQGAFATLNKVTAGNASTYIADAAIGNAQIDRASVNKLVVNNADIDRASVNKLQVVTADIVDANVSTLKIAGNAVTVPLSSYSSSMVSGTGQVLIQSLTTGIISPTVNTILLISTSFQWVNITGNDPYRLGFLIITNAGEVIWRTDNGYGDYPTIGGENGICSINVQYILPANTSRTIYVYGFSEGVNVGEYRYRSLTATAMKR